MANQVPYTNDSLNLLKRPERAILVCTTPATSSQCPLPNALQHHQVSQGVGQLPISLPSVRSPRTRFEFCTCLRLFMMNKDLLISLTKAPCDVTKRARGCCLSLVWCVAGGILDGMTVLDPCCGSGTVPAMACALGARAVLTSDLRAEFLKKTQSNFQHAGIRSHNLALAGESAHTHQGCSGEDILPTLVTLFEHDAKTPFPQEYTAAHQQGEGGSAPDWGLLLAMTRIFVVACCAGSSSCTRRAFLSITVAVECFRLPTV